MTNIANLSRAGISRRDILKNGGAVAILSATSSLPFSVGAKAAVNIDSQFKVGKTASGSDNLMQYHCNLVHKTIGEKWKRISQDTSHSAGQNAWLKFNTNCPCCGDKIISHEMGKNYQLGA